MTLSFGPAVPVLRSFDEARARAFYCGLLGFSVDWAQRPAPDRPLYMQVSRGGFVLHLSEHDGDGRLAARLRIPVHGLDRLRDEMLAQGFPLDEPEEAAAVTLHDPFGNTLHFVEQD